jgi:hypothetical protein
MFHNTCSEQTTHQIPDPKYYTSEDRNEYIYIYVRTQNMFLYSVYFYTVRNCILIIFQLYIKYKPISVI